MKIIKVRFMNNLRGHCQRRLRQCGCKLTTQHELIFELLHKTNGHLSADEIFFELKKKYPFIGLTTVYRTLELLAEHGLINKFVFGDGRARYELIESSETAKHHHHLICSACKKIIDYDDFINEEVELLKKTEKALEKKHNFKITNHLIQFFGLCENCQKK